MQSDKSCDIYTKIKQGNYKCYEIKKHQSPTPHFRRYRGTYTYAHSPYLGKTDGPFYMLFHIISTPFLRNFSQLTPYLGEHYGDPYSISFILISFLRALPLPSRGPTTDMRCNKGTIPFSLEAIEGSGNMNVYKSYPLFLNFSGSF